LDVDLPIKISEEPTIL